MKTGRFNMRWVGLLVAGLLVMGGIGSDAPPVRAAGNYDNAIIADRALGYYNGSNSNRANGKRACADAHKPGDSGGSCRAFVNCIVWMASGGFQNIGGDYFNSFLNAGGSEITDANSLQKGDIVQEGYGGHTSIVVSHGSGNLFMVVDSNHWNDETVGYYQRSITLGSLVRAFRMGTVNHSPYGSLDSLVQVPDGIRASGWAIDPDTTAPISVHVYSGSGALGVGNNAVPTLANGWRPDVDRVFHMGAAHGFSAVVPLTGQGTQQVCAYGINMPAGSNPQLGCLTIMPRNNTPIGALDSVVPVDGGVQVSGWAIDPDTTAPLKVHVYAGTGTPGGGNPGWAIDANADRPDVGRVYAGYGNAHGYSAVLPIEPAPQTICAYAINDQPGANPQLGCRKL